MAGVQQIADANPATAQSLIEGAGFSIRKSTSRPKSVATMRACEPKGTSASEASRRRERARTARSSRSWCPNGGAGAAAALLGIRHDGFGLLHHRCKRLHDVEELLDHVEKSSHAIEEAAAAPPISRDDGFGFKSVARESRHVVFRSRSVVSESRDDRFESRASSSMSFDVRSSFFATMEKFLPSRSESRA
jgi:hypothetical protein